MPMRRLTPMLLLLISFYTNGQSNWHSGVGLTSGTLNFQQNGAGGFIFPIRYDFLRFPAASFSVGSNPVIGTEDKYGIGFPLILGLLLLSDASGSAPDLSGASTGGQNGTTVCLFTQAPLLLQYNWGLGSNNRDYDNRERVGFYLGGGMGWTLTGITNSAGNEHSTSFWGWMGTAGLRFARNKELGFSMTLPCENTIGPISHPLFYQISFSLFH
jgi:hypothetical protein